MILQSNILEDILSISVVKLLRRELISLDVVRFFNVAKAIASTYFADTCISV